MVPLLLGIQKTRFVKYIFSLFSLSMTISYLPIGQGLLCYCYPFWIEWVFYRLHSCNLEDSGFGWLPWKHWGQRECDLLNRSSLPATLSSAFLLVNFDFFFSMFQALLSGCSAGGLASILHCDEFRDLFPRTTKVKCLSDAGLFLDV